MCFNQHGIPTTTLTSRSLLQRALRKAWPCCRPGGLPIALTGVWMGASCNGANSNGDSLYELAHPLDKFSWTSRKVLLAFDADQTRNNMVIQAMIRLTLLLCAKGAEVLNVSWPLSEGKGIDDYLAGKAGTDTDKQKRVFTELVANAVSVIDTVPSSWLPLIEAELRKVTLSVAARSQLCKRLAKPLGVKVSALEQTASAHDEEADPNAARLLEVVEPWPDPGEWDQTGGRFVLRGGRLHGDRAAVCSPVSSCG